MNIWKLFIPFILGFTIITTSCNNHSESGNGVSTQRENRETNTLGLQQPITNDTVRIEITGDDQMRYDKKELRIPAGTVVVLTLKHAGKLPKSAMGHNWVLLEQGIDMANFGQEAMKAKDNDYIPPALEGNIIAHTRMLGGGESDTIIFNSPPIGIYTFLCSFPGHYVLMNGKFIVEKAAPAS